MLDNFDKKSWQLLFSFVLSVLFYLDHDENSNNIRILT
jgi:hypothetical protein